VWSPTFAALGVFRAKVLPKEEIRLGGRGCSPVQGHQAGPEAALHTVTVVQIENGKPKLLKIVNVEPK